MSRSRRPTTSASGLSHFGNTMAVGRSKPLVSGSPSASPRNLVRLSANRTNQTAFRNAQKPRAPIRTNDR